MELKEFVNKITEFLKKKSFGVGVIEGKIYTDYESFYVKRQIIFDKEIGRTIKLYSPTLKKNIECVEPVIMGKFEISLLEYEKTPEEVQNLFKVKNYKVPEWFVGGSVDLICGEGFYKETVKSYLINLTSKNLSDIYTKIIYKLEEIFKEMGIE